MPLLARVRSACRDPTARDRDAARVERHMKRAEARAHRKRLKTFNDGKDLKKDPFGGGGI
jgi:hypothetical protein